MASEANRGERWSKDAILEKLKEFPYWRYRFDLGHGIFTRPPVPFDQHRRRLDYIFPSLLQLCGGSFKGLKVLDVGCSGGFWSIEARKHGADHVLGIDTGDYWVEQSEFIRDVIQIDHVEFRRMSVYELSNESVGQFEVCLFLGVLYHLMKPIEALEKIREVTKKYLVVDSYCLPVKAPILEIYRKPFMPVWTTSAPVAMLPSAGAVEHMLEYVGFNNVGVIPSRGKVPADFRLGIRRAWMAEVPPSSCGRQGSPGTPGVDRRRLKIEFLGPQVGSMSFARFFIFRLVFAILKSISWLLRTKTGRRVALYLLERYWYPKAAEVSEGDRGLDALREMLESDMRQS